MPQPWDDEDRLDDAIKWDRTFWGLWA